MQAADDSFANALQMQLPPDTLRRAEPRYLEEPRGRWHGASQWVALPRNVQEVSAIVAACHAAHVGIVPYGGGTGLVSGQISTDYPALVLSLERMNAIRAVFPEESSAEVEAGAILADVRAAAADRNLLFPVSLASEGSARIGGLLATNAGGINTLRYGNTRDQVLGLQAVLPDGQIWNGLKRLRKDNTGYDLRHLLIGSEGTLGVITAATLKLAPRPDVTGTGLFHVNSPAAALSLLALARQIVGNGISAFELMHRTGFDFLSETMPEIRQPWPHAPEWSVLIELGLDHGQAPQTALETLFENGLEAELVTDGIVAQSETQSAAFWALRENIPTANKKIGSISSHDIALPLGAIPDFLDTAGPALAKLGDMRINCFGHLGDGNLHYNVFPAKGRHRDAYPIGAQVKRCVHDLVDQFDGSVSAEHGLGRHKASDLERYGDPAKLFAMRAIKSALDPKGIMNPGAVLHM